jgi:hypothetical protein
VCHPEAGDARRGTSQALNRVREQHAFFVIAGVMFAGRQKLQL